MMKTGIVLSCVIALVACRDSAKEANRKAEEQRIEADYRAREEQRIADEKARMDKISADKQASDHAIALAKEKADLRSMVEEWINSLDKHLAELHRGTKDSKNGDDMRALAVFVDTLQKDLGDIDRANDADWPSVKERVEKDIAAAKKRIGGLGMVAKAKA